MTTIGANEWLLLLVPAYPACPGQNPESHKTVVCVCVVCSIVTISLKCPIVELGAWERQMDGWMDGLQHCLMLPMLYAAA